jgi:threonine synthase
VLSGWIAREMGAPIARFVVGSNTNDILTRFFTTGAMVTTDVVPTLSPSMDIQVSSNVERLLFELNGRDGGLTAEQLGRFRAVGHLEIEPDQRAQLAPLFCAARADDADTLATMGAVYRDTGLLVDPHTAVGIATARRAPDLPDLPVVALATAHPAKFPDAVLKATGVHPALPAHLADLFDRPERTQVVAADLKTVEDLVERLARSGGVSSAMPQRTPGRRPRVAPPQRPGRLAHGRACDPARTVHRARPVTDRGRGPR